MSVAPPESVLLVTAAGRSGRMGRPKALLPAGLHATASSFVAEILRTAALAGLRRAIVTVPSGEARHVVEAHLGRLEPFYTPSGEALAVASVENLEPALGITGSIRAAQPLASDSALLLWPVDSPLATTSLVRRILATATATTTAQAVVPACGARQGHPVWFSLPSRAELIRPDWPEGPRSFLAALERRGALATVQVRVGEGDDDDDGDPFTNINSPEDWARVYGAPLPPPSPHQQQRQQRQQRPPQ